MISSAQSGLRFATRCSCWSRWNARAERSVGTATLVRTRTAAIAESHSVVTPETLHGRTGPHDRTAPATIRTGHVAEAVHVFATARSVTRSRDARRASLAAARPNRNQARIETVAHRAADRCCLSSALLRKTDVVLQNVSREKRDKPLMMRKTVVQV